LKYGQHIVQANMAHEAAYLGISAVEVSAPLFAIFKKSGVLPAQDELWKKRADYILAMPDPCLDMSPDENAVLAFWTRELVHLFYEWLKPDQIVFKRFPPGNTKVIVSLPAHFVIDLHLLGINNVHKMLAAEASACARKGEIECNCTRELLVQGMMDALTALPGGPRMATLQRTLMRQYQAVTKEPLQNLSPGHMAPEIPAPEPVPKSTATADESDVPSGAEPSETQNGAERKGVVGEDSEGEAPEDAHRPTDVHPIIHRPGLRSEIEKVLGSATPAGDVEAFREETPPDNSETVLRVCKHRVRSGLVRSSVHLGLTDGQAFLYLPEGASETDLPVHQIEELFDLLTRLHLLFGPAQEAFQLYYGPGDSIIAFNKGDRLWYNAAYDQNVTDKPARAEYWYHAICHELAHHYVQEHDTYFSQYVGKITLEYSQAFHAQFKLI
jgi:hypothetical protein